MYILRQYLKYHGVVTSIKQCGFHQHDFEYVWLKLIKCMGKKCPHSEKNLNKHCQFCTRLLLMLPTSSTQALCKCLLSKIYVIEVTGRSVSFCVHVTQLFALEVCTAQFCMARHGQSL